MSFQPVYIPPQLNPPPIFLPYPQSSVPKLPSFEDITSIAQGNYPNPGRPNLPRIPSIGEIPLYGSQNYNYARPRRSSGRRQTNGYYPGQYRTQSSVNYIDGPQHWPNQGQHYNRWGQY